MCTATSDMPLPSSNCSTVSVSAMLMARATVSPFSVLKDSTSNSDSYLPQVVCEAASQSSRQTRLVDAAKYLLSHRQLLSSRHKDGQRIKHQH